MQHTARLSPEAFEDLLTVCVCTYNSAHTLRTCLESIRRVLPTSRLIVIDHYSQDESVEIAQDFGAETYLENVSLGYARQMCFDLVKTGFLSFVDSDVEVTDAGFFRRSLQILEEPRVGAVVGMSSGYWLPYGLPAGLLVLRQGDFEGRIIPSFIDARETYYIQARLNSKGLDTKYLSGAMVHRSEYRKFKPEWEGANTRLLQGVSLKEVTYATGVILLLSLNSRNLRTFLYAPVFLLKFLRGFVEPERWRHLDRLAE